MPRRLLSLIALLIAVALPAFAQVDISASDIASGTLSAARLPASGVTAGTYEKVTVDATGRVTVGTNPTIAGSTILGNNTGSAAVPDALTVAQTQALLGLQGMAYQAAAAVDISGGTIDGAYMPYLSALQGKSYAISDGATSGRRIFYALGAQAPGLPGKTVTKLLQVTIPSAAPSAGIGLWSLASTSVSLGSSVGHSLSLEITNGGYLMLRETGGTVATDYRRLDYQQLITAYGGKTVRMAIVVPGDATSGVAIYIGAKDITPLLVSSAGGGTNPNWMHAALVATYQTVGLNAAAGTLIDGPLIHGELSSADILVWTKSGKLPDWCAFPGSTVPIISPTINNGGFEAVGAGGSDVFANWTESASGASTVNRDSTDYYAGAASCRLNVDASGSFAGLVYNGILQIGAAYRMDYASKGSETNNLVGSNSGFALPGVTTSWARYTTTSRAILVDLSLKRQSGSDSFVWLDDITLYRLGVLISPSVQSGSVVLDTSGNGLSGVATAGIMQVDTTGRSQYYIRTRTATSSSQQLLGASCVAVGDAITRIWARALSGTPSVSVGNAAGGSQIVTTTALSSTWKSLSIVGGGDVATTANLWATSTTTDTIEWVIACDALTRN